MIDGAASAAAPHVGLTPQQRLLACSLSANLRTAVLANRRRVRELLMARTTPAPLLLAAAPLREKAWQLLALLPQPVLVPALPVVAMLAPMMYQRRLRAEATWAWR